MPGDKSIGHRALLLSALSDGQCHLSGLSSGLDNIATQNALAAMGVNIERTGDKATVEGVGLRGLKMASDVIDCGNSGTSMRLLAGLLCAQKFGSQLTGDDSLSARPMQRIIEPLRARGAHIGGRAGADTEALYPPISIAPLLDDEHLRGLQYAMPIASAQVKSALLLSGLYADGPTVLSEPVLSRDHTERMLLSLGVPITTEGPMVALDPTDWRAGWDAFDWTVPGDPSSAAFVLLAALMVQGSEVTVTDVCVNPTRTGLFDLLRAMGVQLDWQPTGAAAGDEPTATLGAKHQRATGATVGGELLVRMIDEVPALCALAAVSKGQTHIRDAQELRVKESDRIATMANVLGAFGVPCEELADGLVVDGGAELQGATVQSRGDHRIAMAAVLLGLRARGQTVVTDVECVETSFVGFCPLLQSLGADIEEFDA